MAKFYVTSGEVRVVVDAQDAHAAALWSLHLSLSKVTDLEDLDLSPEQRDDLAQFDAISRFDRWTKVSEIGFGREEGGRFDSLSLMIEWNQLATAVVRLERLIAGTDEEE